MTAEGPTWWLALLATYLVHSTVLLAATWLILGHRRLRDGSHADYWWKVMVLLPLGTTTLQMAWFQPLVPLRWPTTNQRSAATRRTAEARQASEAFGNDRWQNVGARDEDLRGARSELRHTISAASGSGDVDQATKMTRSDFGASLIGEHATSSEASSSDDETNTSSTRLSRVLGLWPWVFAVFTSAAIIRMGLLWLRLDRWLKHCRPCHGQARAKLDELLATLGWKPERVDLLEADGSQMPAAAGLFRWRIILPAGLDSRLSPQDLHAVLAHELGHHVRHDLWWQWLLRSVCGGAPFQPLNFVAWRYWRQASECACDEWAVRHGAHPLALAHSLTKLAELRLGQAAAGGAIARTRSSGLTRRVERLLDLRPLDERHGDRRAHHAIVAAGLLFAAAALLPGMSLSGPSPLNAESQNDHAQLGKPWTHLSDLPSSPFRASEFDQLDAELAALDRELDQLTSRRTDLPRPAAGHLEGLRRRASILREYRNHLRQLAQQLPTTEGDEP